MSTLTRNSRSVNARQGIEIKKLRRNTSEAVAASTLPLTAAEVRAVGFFDVTNDGAGSGLDADLLDGLNASAFQLAGSYQPLDATLTSIGLLGTVADRLAYTTGVDVWAETPFTAAGRALVDDADAAAQRTTLGLGTLATQSGTFSGTSSGTNTGDQTITLTGDVTGSGTGSFATALLMTAARNWTAGIHTFSAQDVHNDGVSLGTSGRLNSAVADAAAASSFLYKPTVAQTSGTDRYIHHFQDAAGNTGLVMKADGTWEFGGSINTGGYINIRTAGAHPYGVFFFPNSFSSTTTIGGIATAVAGAGFVVPVTTGVNSFGGEFRINAGTASTTSTENFAAMFHSTKSVSNTMTRFGLIYLVDTSSNAKGTLTDWAAIYGASIGSLNLGANRAWINLIDLTKASVTGAQNSILLGQSNVGYKALAFRDQNAWINSDAASDLDLNAATSIDLNIGGTEQIGLTAALLTFKDVFDIAVGTGTGTKIGTATGQKLGFWNVTPIIQPAAALQAAITNSTGGTQDGTLAALASVGIDVVLAASQTDVNSRMTTINNNFTDVYALLDAIRTALVNSGLMKGAA